MSATTAAATVIQRAKQAITDAWDFGPGHSREENLKDNHAFTKSQAARTLQEYAE